MAKQRGKTKYFDYSLLVIILFLVCFGLVMVYSTSYYSGMRLTKPDPAFYLKKQLLELRLTMQKDGLMSVLVRYSRQRYASWLLLSACHHMSYMSAKL